MLEKTLAAGVRPASRLDDGVQPASRLDEIRGLLVNLTEHLNGVTSRCQAIIDKAEGAHPPEVSKGTEASCPPGILGDIENQISCLNSVADTLDQRVNYLSSLI